jgi:cytochrome c peroxidase
MTLTTLTLRRRTRSTRKARPALSAHVAMALALTLALFLVHGAAQAADTSPAQQLRRFSAQAGTPAQAERGRVFFTNRQGGEWSCASCHGSPPTKAGKHASTGKTIDAMAPAANPNAFTDTAKVDKWFRRNCKDVLQRECSAGEKADVLAYLIDLKP